MASVCPNCGKEINSLTYRPRGYFWEPYSGDSWANYREVFYYFCSARCFREYRRKERERIKKVLKSENRKDFRKFLIRKNHYMISEIMVSLVFMGFLVWIASYQGITFSPLSFPAFFVLFVSAIFWGYILFRFLFPWIRPLLRRGAPPLDFPISGKRNSEV